MRVLELVILAAIAGLVVWGAATSFKANSADRHAIDSRKAVATALAMIEAESRAGRPIASLAALPGGMPHDGYGQPLALLRVDDPRVPAGCFGVAALGMDAKPGGEGDAEDWIAFGRATWLAGGNDGVQITPRVALTKARIREIAVAVERFVALAGRWPMTLADLMTPPSDVPEWPEGGLLADAESLRDGWGRPFTYATPTPGGSAWSVRSLGSDGEPGGKDDAADLSNHAEADDAASS
jgi:general secretion pathway protein G